MEVIAAVHRLKEKKAPSADNVTAEKIQAAGEAGIHMNFAKRHGMKKYFRRYGRSLLSQFTRNMTS